MAPPAPCVSLSLLLFFFLSISAQSVQVSARPPPDERATTAAGDQPKPPPNPQPPNNSLNLTSSCAGAPYPSLCVHILSFSQLPTATADDLARAAVSASVSFSINTTDFLSKAADGAGSQAVAVAIKDCKQQLGNSADLLARALSELGQLKPEKSQSQLDNALTRVSAALTNDRTCLDGLQRVEAPPGVTRRVSAVSWVTSDALYLVNRLSLAAKKGRGH